MKTETKIKPEIGMGATEICYSDWHTYTIISVSPSGKTIKLQRDKATLLNGMNSGEPDALNCTPGGFAAHVTGKQRYSYEIDPQGIIRKATLRKDGKYGMVGSSRSNVLIGTRSEYYDYNF